MQTWGYLFILAAKPSGFVLFYFLFCFRELPLYIQCQAAWIDRFNFCYSPGYSNNPYISCNYHPAFHLQLYNGLSLCIFNHPLITSSSPNGCCLISKQIITQVPDTGSCTARVSLTTHLQSAANADACPGISSAETAGHQEQCIWVCVHVCVCAEKQEWNSFVCSSLRAHLFLHTSSVAWLPYLLLERKVWCTPRESKNELVVQPVQQEKTLWVADVVCVSH